MTAATLREAAAKMRELAEAATPGPWHLDGPWWIDTTGYDMVTGRDRKAVAVPGEPTANPADMAHVRSWHPAVALAVADWLDDEIAKWGDEPACLDKHALTVARTFLGRAES